MYMDDDIVNKITNAIELFKVERNNELNEANQHGEDWIPPPPRLLRQVQELKIVDSILSMLQRNITCIFIESSFGMNSFTYVVRDLNDNYYLVTRNVMPETFEVSSIRQASVEQAQARFAVAPVEVVPMEEEGWGF